METFSTKSLWRVIRLTFKDFSKVNITKKSAALAYYTLFSLPGMLMVIITILDTVYGREAGQGTVRSEVSSLVGPVVALQIEDLIHNAAISGKTTIAAVAGVATLVVGATKMFSEIQDSINLIWNLRAKPKKGWVKLLINRLVSFSMVVTLGFLLLVSLVISGLVLVLSQHLAAYLPGFTLIFVSVLNSLLSFIVTVILFAIIFKVLPDAKIRWRDVTVGAVATTLLFMIGKLAIGIYLRKSNVESTYGAAGSIIIMLLWIYYSAIILYFGAAFTKEYAQHFGLQIYPADNAVWIKEIEIESGKPLQEIEKISEEGKIQAGNKQG